MTDSAEVRNGVVFVPLGGAAIVKRLKGVRAVRFFQIYLLT